MDGNFKPYDYVKSSDRIREILNQPSGAFEEVDSLPDRDKLTYTNGYYAKCSAVFVDIRDSSGLTETYKRPTLAKIYRAFISEMVAVLNSDELVREVNIVGYCVWASYNTPLKSDINRVFSITSQANTLLKLLNHHFEKKCINPLRIGIGVDYGRVLMIKAGYAGSGINDVIYMGDVINRAAHLGHEAGRNGNDPIIIGSWFQTNLDDHNKSLLTQTWINELGTVYRGNFVRTEMNNWIADL